jgi:hypothetical protein
MRDLKPPEPATASEVASIVGKLDDDIIAGIVATGATAAEVLEAYTWLSADDQLGTELQRQPVGRVAEVCGILAADQPDEEP